MKNFILLLLITSFAYAQSTLSGLVVDEETNLPLADANILIKSDSLIAEHHQEMMESLHF